MNRRTSWRCRGLRSTVELSPARRDREAVRPSDPTNRTVFGNAVIEVITFCPVPNRIDGMAERGHPSGRPRRRVISPPLGRPPGRGRARRILEWTLDDGLEPGRERLGEPLGHGGAPHGSVGHDRPTGTPDPVTLDVADSGDICDTCLRWAARRDYAGYDPYDGLNSPYVSALARNWLTRLIGMQAVNKAPINLRPVLDVPKERNPKGIALFTSAYLNRYRETGRDGARENAERLLRWLDENQSPGYDEAAWGYPFDWQNARKFFLPAAEPSIVVTVFCGRAFLRYYEVTGEPWALERASSAVSFVREHVNRRDVDGVDVFTYTADDSFVLVNTNALAADFFYRVAAQIDSMELEARAEELFDFVVGTQGEGGGWHYSVPSSESHLSQDNFHTGFVLESLHDYALEQPIDHPVRAAYRRGMAFYRRELFDESGAPRFEADKRYPYDVHAAAQAIITFVQRGNADDWALVRDVFEWSIENLYDSEGYFYRRVGRVLTDRTPYMRWSQAWMCRALSALSYRSSAE